jgi:hypothetical protein
MHAASSLYSLLAIFVLLLHGCSFWGSCLVVVPKTRICFRDSNLTQDSTGGFSVTNKPFNIDKRLVYEAYKAVKSNRGAAGVDEQTIEQFESDLSGNLYKIWNRRSSGTYFPPPVRAVAIPKKSGGERILGVPTVADRVAQMVIKRVIEPILDPIFLADSYGYRPNKSLSML